MAITLLMGGGLGNQLFEYAAARALSLARGAPLILDLRYYTRANQGAAKAPWLLDFPLKARVRAYRSPAQAHGLLPRITRRIVERHRRFDENDDGYDARLADQPDGTVMSGVFQSPRYFAHVSDQFANELDLSQRPGIIDNPLVSRFDLQGAVGVHVRRGDYLDIPGFAMKDSEAYYAAVMNEARQRGEHVVVFSDDIAWCREAAVFSGATFYPSEPDAPPYVDLFAMSQCRRLAIANSSFSWWAGWFAHQRGAEITAPRWWTFDRPSEEIAILPAEWRQLPT